MSTISALDQFLDPTNGWFTPQTAQKMLDWKPDPAIKARLLELGSKAAEGTLTPEEDAEYEQYIEEGDVIALFQIKARRALGLPPSSA